ncbi:putative inactive carboxylesterase 4 [Mercenaria mercenaria]|uniref:putative inactive carboxylesterase 4 n=1 Tax=Mercenaria mercenaria TaxID=6596 RepID=UPI00234F64EB|nr:putative inactive carboxylesterase 4 [Mercenaria mercenaria]
MKFKHIPLYTILWILEVLGSAVGNIIVSTKSGDVAGYTLDIQGHNSVGSQVTSLNIFLGIPYAEPPVGKLRFARPVSKRPWSPTRLDALRFSPACPQPVWFLRRYSFLPTYNNTDEDCLYLNIYAPHNSADPDLKYPVLIWIHGGSYKYGSGAEYDGRILAQEGVVVVTINYRVGIMGFLSTDDDVAPGNYGLLDQLMALKWVKDNAVHFHGDPDRITIAGQSAGGGSVSLHMFSPLAKGLFNSMIPQSGCALSPWAIYRPPHKIQTYTQSIAMSVGCTASTSSDMIACLRSKDANLLVDTKVEALPMISTFAPRVDGFYIHDLPEVLLERGDYLHHINVMNGFLPNEVSEDYESEPGIAHGLTRSHLEQLFYIKSRRYLANAADMYSALKCAYPPGNKNTALNRDHLINMNSDYGYVVPHIKLS